MFASAEFEFDADNARAPREQRIQGSHRVSGIEVAQEAGDEARGRTVGARGFVERRPDALDDGGQRNTAARVRLRIEEDLRVADVLRACARQIGAGEVMEIAFRQERAGRLVIEVEEILQVLEIIRRPQRLDGGIGQINPISFGKREDHLRLQRALDMQVELGFRQAVDEFGDRVRHWSFRTAVHGPAVFDCDPPPLRLSRGKVARFRRAAFRRPGPFGSGRSRGDVWRILIRHWGRHMTAMPGNGNSSRPSVNLSTCFMSAFAIFSTACAKAIKRVPRSSRRMRRYFA